jgi:hypothetical protein
MTLIQSAPARVWLFLTFSSICGALLYGPHLGAPLVFDDIAFFSSNYASQYGIGFGGTNPRWWPYWTFAVQRILLGEENLFLFRLGNLVLHVLTVNALFLFLRQLFSALLPNRADTKVVEPYSVDAMAAFAAMVFLLHPIAVYAAAYLVERSILMATLFSILMWLAHLRGLESRKPVWFVLAVLCCYLALYSKELSVMAPVVTVLLTLALRKRELPWRYLAPTFFAYAFLIISITLKVKGVIASSSLELQVSNIVAQLQREPGWQLPDNVYLVSVLAQCMYFFKYIFLWFVPLTSWMAIDIQESVLDNAGSWMLWLSALAYVAWCLAGFILILRRGMAALLGFALLAPALLFATEFSSVRIQEPFVLYRSYLWAPALFAAIPLVFHKVRPQLILVAGIVVATVLAVLAQERLMTFSSEFAVWGDAIHLAERSEVKSPMRARQYYNRGSAFLNSKRPQSALEDFERALSFSSRYLLAFHGKGMALMRLGRFREAKASFDQALAIKPDYAQTLFARSVACSKIGDEVCADNDLKKACALGYTLACYYREKKNHPGDKEVVIRFR